MPQSEPRREAIIAVTGELLLHVLKLPAGTSILGAKGDFHNDRVDFHVSHPDLNPLAPDEEGRAIPRINPQYVRGEDGQAKFVEWGQS